MQNLKWLVSKVVYSAQHLLGSYLLSEIILLLLLLFWAFNSAPNISDISFVQSWTNDTDDELIFIKKPALYWPANCFFQNNSI